MSYEEEDTCMSYERDTNSEKRKKGSSLPVSLTLPPFSLSDSLSPPLPLSP